MIQPKELQRQNWPRQCTQSVADAKLSLHQLFSFVSPLLVFALHCEEKYDNDINTKVRSLVKGEKSKDRRIHDSHGHFAFKH